MTTSRENANALRALAMDAVEKAASGHPGMPMGMADIAEVLWNRFLKHDPSTPTWWNRDRFVLSNGHGSMLLYGLLHLSGYDLPLDELKRFRQLHSMTPGHPEFREAPGVETTTGPLGQGLANAVGMAIAERVLAARFNREGFPLFDHKTYVFLGDGCLMEGISHEACSLAGTLGLHQLIAFWDDNGISIDGKVEGWFSEDVALRFRSYGWNVIEKVDGHDAEHIAAAILKALACSDRPSILLCRTTIGFGAPTLGGTAKAHGSPLGSKEIQAAREKLGWTHAPFEIPDDIRQSWDARARGKVILLEWQELFTRYQSAHPKEAKQLQEQMSLTLPKEWNSLCSDLLSEFQTQKPSLATRKASQLCLERLAPTLPQIIGGSADLTESNLTFWEKARPLHAKDFSGNYLYYGVREFGMSAMMNGLALHGGFQPFGGTFLTFSDYARNAVRMSAIMQLPCVFVYTHDSIGLGEDGPTHQPIEHASSLRLIPGLRVFRPCDAVETAFAWQQALEHRGPSCLLLSRQALPTLPRTTEQMAAMQYGAYTLFETDPNPKILLMATGSEVSIAFDAAQAFAKQGGSIRVISMLSTDGFDRAPENYREALLPLSSKHRIAVEAGSRDFWYKYVGLHGKILGLDTFGASAPAKDLFSFFHLTEARVLETILTMQGETT